MVPRPPLREVLARERPQAERRQLRDAQAPRQAAGVLQGPARPLRRLLRPRGVRQALLQGKTVSKFDLTKVNYSL